MLFLIPNPSNSKVGFFVRPNATTSGATGIGTWVVGSTFTVA